MIFSSVDLPEPEGPHKQTNSPCQWPATRPQDIRKRHRPLDGIPRLYAIRPRYAFKDDHAKNLAQRAH